jgi:hypothetical protein
MKEFARSVRPGVVSGLAVLATWAAIAPIAAHGQIKPNVTVVNPVSNPVNTRITNAVVPVEISNADAIPVVAQESEGSREIFTRRVTVGLAGGAGNCNHLDPITVPSGKRMVIEYLSANSAFNAPVALVSISLNVPDQGLLAVVPAGKTAFGDEINYAAAGQYVHAYSDGPLWACAFVSDSSSQDLIINVTGYYVDKP